MCGICGIYNKSLSKKEKSSVLNKMNAALLHRGPNDDGLYLGDNCCLGMRRLSIIDLHSGKQPIFNETEDICVFFNGEIYNYKELRSTLEDKGHIFQTNSDTEVLVHLYEEYQDNLSLQLKGMFVFCIYDMKQDKLLISRDRFGEKPLYYYQNGTHFSFSSEVKSLLEDCRIERGLNLEALPYYLSNTFVPEPLTLIKDVYSLPPGHSLVYHKNTIKVQKYFSIDYQPDTSIKTDNDAIEFIKPYLEQSVKRQMISDVPLGAFLSGGIDSSTIVASLQKFSHSPIKTFTVKFEDSSYDESGVAKEVADFLGTEHHEILFPNESFSEDIFWKIIDHVGLPFADNSAIPSYFITKEIKKYVTVALSGDGGDELFAGYDLYQWWQRLVQLKKTPKSIRTPAEHLIKLYANLPFSINKVRQALKALEIVKEPYSRMIFTSNLMFKRSEIEELYKNSSGRDLSCSLFAVFPPESKNWSDLRFAMYYRMMHDLPLDMLTKVDRMSMANSLEVRAPFLDPDLFEASTKLPDKFLIKNGKGKYIIRKAMNSELPQSVFNHPKKGFGIPFNNYRNKAFRDLADGLFVEESPLAKILDLAMIHEIKEEALSTNSNNKKFSVYRSMSRLWSLMQLFGWVKRFNIQC